MRPRALLEGDDNHLNAYITHSVRERSYTVRGAGHWNRGLNAAIAADISRIPVDGWVVGLGSGLHGFSEASR